MELTQTQTEDLVARIVEAARPERIILFGSAARGEAGRHSDIDVLVVAPEGSHRGRTAEAVYLALLGFGIAVDVVIYREALRDGRELYAA
jgi:predicted nucleotidyltransferase